jgi:hypothetical protein
VFFGFHAHFWRKNCGCPKKNGATGKKLVQTAALLLAFVALCSPAYYEVQGENS